MRNAFVILAAVCVVAGVCVAGALGPRAGQDVGEEDFAIYVSPGRIVTDGPCNCVTIHTDVPFSTVKAAAVKVDGQTVKVDSAFADDRGNIVVKVAFTDVVEIVEAPEATVALKLTVIAGENVTKDLTACETVPVK